MAITSGWNVSQAKNCSGGWRSHATASVGGQPGVPQPVPGQQEDRDGAGGDRHHLEQVPDVGAGTEPGQGDQEEVGEGGVVAEDRQPAHGHEVLEPRQQPDRLVVDAEVEVDRAPVVVAQHDQPAEDHDPQHHRADQHPQCRLRPQGSRTTQPAGLRLSLPPASWPAASSASPRATTAARPRGRPSGLVAHGVPVHGRSRPRAVNVLPAAPESLPALRRSCHTDASVSSD